MKVLHLAPPAVGRDALTAHSFIDEEMRALSAAGICCYVQSDATADRDGGNNIPVVGVAPSRGRRVSRMLTSARTNARNLPFSAIGNPRQLMHALCVEDAAAALVVKEKIDLIHSHFGWPGGFGGTLASAASGVALVASLRGMDLLVRADIGYGLRRDGAYGAAITRLLATAHRTIYATDFLRREGLEAGAPADRAVIVRKGVDLNRFRPSADRPADQARLGFIPPVILAVGTLGPRKGHRHLLEALHGLRSLPWTLVICGEGPDRHALEDRARDLSIADRVRFLGQVSRSEIGRYFGAADVFVHVALIEAAGNVILESQASGCATIASDSGGPPEYIVAGETGLIVPPGDPVALRHALETVLVNPALRQQMGATARRIAEAHYAYPRMIADLIGVYRSASGHS